MEKTDPDSSLKHEKKRSFPPSRGTTLHLFLRKKDPFLPGKPAPGVRKKRVSFLSLHLKKDVKEINLCFSSMGQPKTLL